MSGPEADANGGRRAPSTDRPFADRPLTRDQLYRGAALFLAFTAIGLTLLFVFSVRGEATLALRNLSHGFIALAVLSSVLDLLIGAVRYQIFLRKIDPETSFWLPIRADLANRFAGAVTPSQTGGGPAQIFVLHRGGIPLPAALSFLMINFLATAGFFLTAGAAAAFLLWDSVDQSSVQLLLRYGFAGIVVLFLLLSAALLWPDAFSRLLVRLVNRLERRPDAPGSTYHGRSYGRSHRRSRDGPGGEPRASTPSHRRTGAGAGTRALRWLVDNLDQYRAACALFIRESPALLVQSFLLTVVLYVNKYTLAYFVMRGLGVDGDYFTVLAIQALLHVILYVAPSPGGSGIAEVSTGALMAILMPAHLLGYFTFGYRFFLIYLPAVLGGLVLAREFRGMTHQSMGHRTEPPGKRGSEVPPAHPAIPGPTSP